MSTRVYSAPPRHEDPWLRRLEVWTLSLERPWWRWARNAWWVLFYHSGTLALWTFVLLALTGVYTTLFYRFGLDKAYQAVLGLDAQLVGRGMRAAHRYLGDLLLILTGLHAWRMVVQQRFKGPRRWAWAAGVGLVVVTWLTGVSGFWLLVDVRARWLHEILRSLTRLRTWQAPWLLRFLAPRLAPDQGWMYTAALFGLHLLLAATMAGFYWWHIRHLHRARWFPPKPWMWALFLAVACLSLLAPIPRLPFWDSPHVDTFSLNLFYLAWPAWLPGGAFPWLLLAGLVVLLAALPWWWRPALRPQPVELDPQACIGCTLCARDCPYLALEMVPRQGTGTPWVAHLWPERCVGCGICVGSCPTDALKLPGPLGHPQELRKALGQGRGPVVVACYRHLTAHPRTQVEQALEETGAHLVAVPCVGMVHPDVLAQAWKQGPREVRVIGCPPEDCPERFGNIWLEARLRRQRKPWLRTRWRGFSLRWHWVPPTELFTALRGSGPSPSALTMSQPGMPWWKCTPWPLLGSLWLVLALVLWGVNQIPFPGPGSQGAARLALWVRYPPGMEAPQAGSIQALSLWLDGQPWQYQVLQETWGPGQWTFWDTELPPGLRELEVYLIQAHTHQQQRVLVRALRGFWKRGHEYTFRWNDPSQSAEATEGSTGVDWEYPDG